MKLVAVVPTYNEVGSLERFASALFAVPLPDVDVHLLVVDDASTDGTPDAATRVAASHPGRVELLQRTGARGLGNAYVEGFARALANGADLIAQMDADLSHDPAALAAMCEAVRDADMVIGSRYVRGGSLDPQWGWHRKMLSATANRVVMAVLTVHVNDATSGYRLWRRDALAAIAPSLNVRSSGYAFQVEMVHLAERRGHRIREVPIHFRERDAGQSKMNLRVALTAVRELWSMRRQAAE